MEPLDTWSGAKINYRMFCNYVIFCCETILWVDHLPAVNDILLMRGPWEKLSMLCWGFYYHDYLSFIFHSFLQTVCEYKSFCNSFFVVNTLSHMERKLLYCSAWPQSKPKTLGFGPKQNTTFTVYHLPRHTTNFFLSKFQGMQGKVSII